MRKSAWIALGLLLVCSPLMAQQPQPTEETTPPEQKSSAIGNDINELKGDRLGENLDVFMANHPKANCKTRDTSLSDCHVWDQVSIAGVMVRGVEKCASETSGSTPTMNCMQGIDAHFVGRLLAGLSYLVEGDAASKDRIVSEFKQEYGAATTEDTNQTVWSNDLIILSVTLLKPTAGSSYVAITLDLKPSDVGEDI